MENTKIQLTEEKETLLATLYAKALESRAPDSILGDTMADDVVRRIDYDFAKLKLRKDDPFSVAIRAKYLDAWTLDFFARQPSAVVLNLGCGLDSRVFRIDPPASVDWYDVDYPEVIALRRRLFPECSHCHMVGSSVTESDWLEAIPGDRPVLMVAEGLLPYLQPADGIALLRRIVAHFPQGEMVFDPWTRLAVRLYRLQPTVRSTGATMAWGIDDPQELEQAVPGLRFADERCLLDPAQIPELARLSASTRAAARIFSRVPLLRRMARLLRYRF